jgi:hypothetical protein
MSKSLGPLYKGKVTLELGRWIHAIENEWRSDSTRFTIRGKSEAIIYTMRINRGGTSVSVQCSVISKTDCSGMRWAR